MKFTLTIELGNDKMRTRNHISDALKTVASQIDARPYKKMEGDEARIRDDNGNTVGEWKFEES